LYVLSAEKEIAEGKIQENIKDFCLSGYKGVLTGK